MKSKQRPKLKHNRMPKFLKKAIRSRKKKPESLILVQLHELSQRLSNLEKRIPPNFSDSFRSMEVSLNAMQNNVAALSEWLHNEMVAKLSTKPLQDQIEELKKERDMLLKALRGDFKQIFSEAMKETQQFTFELKEITPKPRRWWQWARKSS